MRRLPALGLGSAILLLLAAGLLLLTPAGSWVLARVAAALAPRWGWQLEVGGVRGAPLTGPSFGQLSARNEGAGIRLEASRVSLEPWAYSLTVSSPEVDVILRPAAEPSAADTASRPPVLPVSRLPRLRVRGGQVTVLAPADSLRLGLVGVSLRYDPDAAAAAATPGGELVVEVDAWKLARGGRELGSGHGRARARLAPAGLQLSEVEAGAVSGHWAGQVRGRADLALAPGLPLQARAAVTVKGDSGASGALAVEVEGDLAPRDLRLSLGGQVAHPAVGEAGVGAAMALRPGQIEVDSLQLGLLGGQVRAAGAYWPGADSLVAAASWRDLQLGTVSGSGADGRLSGRAEAAGAPAARRLRASLAARVEDLELPPGPPMDVEVNASLDPGGGAAVQVRSAAGQVAARGRVDLAGGYVLDLSGALRPAVVLGRDMGEVRLSGRLVPDTVACTLSGVQLPVQVQGLAPARLDLELTGGRRLAADLSLAAGAARLAGRLDLARTHLDTARVRAVDLDLSRVAPSLAGRLQARGQAGGTLQIPGLGGAASLHLEELAVGDWRLGAAAAQVRLTGRGVSAAVQADGVEAQVEVDTALQVLGTARLEDARLRAPSGAAGGPGREVVASGEVRVSGPLSTPGQLEAAAALERLEVRWGRWQARAASPVVASFQDGCGRLEPARVETPLGAVEVAGAGRADSLAVTVRIDSLDLQALHPELAGDGWLAVAVRGPAAAPRIAAQVQTGGLTMAGRPLGVAQGVLALDDSLQVRVELRQAKGTAGATGPVPLAAWEPADSSLLVRLALPREPRAGSGPPVRGSLRVEARRLSFGSLARWVLDDSVDGVLDASCRLELPVPGAGEGGDWSGLSGRLAVDRARIEKAGFRAALRDPVRADLAAGEVVVSPVVIPFYLYRRDLQRLAPAGQLRAQGHLGGEAGRELTVAVDSMDLAAIEHLPGLRDLELPDGSLSLRASVRGALGAPQYGGATQVDLEDLGEVTARVDGGPRGMSAAALWRTPGGDSLKVAAEVPAAGDSGLAWGGGRLHLLSERLAADVFLEVLPQLESLGGVLRGDVVVSGLGAEPQVEGAIEARGLSFALLDVKPEYRLPDGALVFAGSRGELEGFAGPAHGGRVELGGFVELASLADVRYRLEVALTDVPYRYDTVFEAPDVDANLAFSRAGGEALLEGDVRLTGALAEVPLVDLTAPPIPPPPAVKDLFLEATRLNVFVDVRDLAVRNELADLSLEGSTRVYGTFYKPRFQGEMEIVDGQVIVLSRTFEFTKGTMVLDQLVPTYSILDLAYDPLLLNPELDVAATTTVRPIDPDEETRQVTMTVAGPAQEVAPRFSCEGLGDTEILSLLAFGSTTTTNYQDALYTTAGQLVLSRGATRVGLDEFQLLPRGTVLSTADGAALRVGKHLTFPLPMWVRYEALTNDPAIGQLRVEYDVTSYVRLKATAQSQYQVYGLGIGFRKDF